MTIGDLIRAARKSRGLTQNELAHAMGITGSAIGQYECGVRIPKYETVERISSALSVPTSSLMPGVSSEIERLLDRCAKLCDMESLCEDVYRVKDAELTLDALQELVDKGLGGRFIDLRKALKGVEL